MAQAPRQNVLLRLPVENVDGTEPASLVTALQVLLWLQAGFCTEQGTETRESVLKLWVSLQRSSFWLMYRPGQQ